MIKLNIFGKIATQTSVQLASSRQQQVDNSLYDLQQLISYIIKVDVSNLYGKIILQNLSDSD